MKLNEFINRLDEARETKINYNDVAAKLKQELKWNDAQVEWNEKNKCFDYHGLPGSSMKKEIKNAWKELGLDKTGLKIIKIDFTNWGNRHGYEIFVDSNTSKPIKEKSNIKEIIADAVENFDDWYRYDEIDEEGIDKSFFKEYVNQCPYELNKKDYPKILTGIYNKVKNWSK